MSGLETFFAAWGETDANTRAAMIADAVSDPVWYADPRTPEPITSVSALIDYVGMFSANAPGWTARVVRSDETAGWQRATVAFGGKGPDGAEMVQYGQYFAELANGKLTRLVGFVGTGAPE